MTESAALSDRPFGRPYTLSPHDRGMVIEGTWPAIFFGKERVEEIRSKVQRLSWAQSTLSQMIHEAEAVLKTEPVQPVEPVGWRHDFYSRKSGQHLVYDPDSPDQYLDPETGIYESLPEQRMAWVLLTHERTHRLMRSLGFLYALTDDERYARWVAGGMKRALAMFRTTELRDEALHENKRYPALYFQPLYDAPVLMQLCSAYGLTRDSGAYSDEEHEAIRSEIFQEGVKYQIDFIDEIGVHNMACYVSAAVAMVGEEFGRQDWIERGLYDDRNGLEALLMRGVPEDDDGRIDGFWFEGTMFYHFYSLCPLITMVEMDKRHRKQVDSPRIKERFAAMFEAPVRLAGDDLRLPTLGDLGAPDVMNLRLYRHLYEYAARHVDAGRFGPVLAEIYGDGQPVAGLSTLAFGPDGFSESKPPPRHALLNVRGIGKMCDENMELVFKVGPHGAGHDHADKLQIAINARGRIIGPDPGTGGYSLQPINGFYRSTFAHNTLFVDEQSQAPAEDCEMLWRPEARSRYARGIVRDAYEGVTLTRHVWFDPPFVVLEDEYVSDEEHRYGWIFHAYGSMHGGVSNPIDDIHMPPMKMLEEFMTAARSECTDGTARAHWRVDRELWLSMTVSSDGPYQATFGRIPANPRVRDFGTVLLRAPGIQRQFLAVFEVHSGRPSVQSVKHRNGEIVVAIGGGETRRYVAAEDEKPTA